MIDNIFKDLDTVIEYGFNMKINIVRSILTNEVINKNEVNSYLKHLDEILKKYNDYSNSCLEKIKSMDPILNDNSIAYDSISNYIYSKDDYSSILQYVDGLLKGIRGNEFTNRKEMEDFTSYIKSKAFSMPDSIGSIMDTINNLASMNNTNETDIVKFNAIKNYNFFNNTDSYEASRSINKIASFLFNNFEELKNEFDPDIFRLLIESIFEYVNYTIASYLGRIYIISKYINSYENETMTESHYLLPSDLYSNTIDDTLVLDVAKFNKFRESLFKISKSLDLDINEELLSRMSWDGKDLVDNSFYKKLNKVELFKFLHKPYITVNSITSKGGRNIEYHTILKSLYYNKQNLGNTISGKDEILSIIKSIKTEDIDNAQRCKNIMKEFIQCSIKLLIVIINELEFFVGEKRYEVSFNKDLRVSEQSMMEVIYEILAELYRDTAIAVLYKLRELETKYNILNMKENESIVSGMKLIDYSTNSDSVLPDTLRSIDITNEYIRSFRESAKLEQLTIMYEYNLFDDDYFIPNEYFGEGVSIADIIEKIKTFFIAIRDRMKKFFENTQVKNASKWVESNKNTLLNMEMQGTLEVLPYQKDINLTYVNDIVKKIDDIKNNIDSIIETDESLNKFIDSMYTINGKNLKDTFKDDKKKTNNILSNMILFNKTSESDVVEPIRITDSNINNYLKDWIETILGMEDATKNITNKYDSIIRSMDFIKTLKTATVNEQNKKEDNGDNKEEIQLTDKSSRINILLSELNSVCTNLINPSYDIMSKAFKDQYKYITEAYTIRKK